MIIYNNKTYKEVEHKKYRLIKGKGVKATSSKKSIKKLRSLQPLSKKNKRILTELGFEVLKNKKQSK